MLEQRQEFERKNKQNNKRGNKQGGVNKGYRLKLTKVEKTFSEKINSKINNELCGGISNEWRGRLNK